MREQGSVATKQVSMLARRLPRFLQDTQWPPPFDSPLPLDEYIFDLEPRSKWLTAKPEEWASLIRARLPYSVPRLEVMKELFEGSFQDTAMLLRATELRFHRPRSTRGESHGTPIPPASKHGFQSQELRFQPVQSYSTHPRREPRNTDSTGLEAPTAFKARNSDSTRCKVIPRTSLPKASFAQSLAGKSHFRLPRR